MEEKKFDTLMLFQIIFAILVMLISIHGMVTENYNLQPLMSIFMSVMLLIIGLREYKRTQSLLWGIFYICTSLFILFVAVKGIMID
ncbi:DUF3953 domain-containing protein [Paenisporosarcina sp. OV554]|uniref:DUF3953 domain-containing protein n=1 Tax=Paenisporosarcina sp. OV554 TaxID=2135694 RepID=UPI000D38346A|nr:DUF3953 domain-containing protein [Paenisporosarcina sp. OV554]PUB05081.1 uncharacterized protein DUF3953 [Paenisporosarcina sp. OV554]